MSLLAKYVLFGAAVLTVFYLLGFMFMIIGSPVGQFVAVLDLLRSVAMTVWVVWAVVRTGERIMRVIREQRLATLADEIGMEEPRTRWTAVN